MKDLFDRTIKVGQGCAVSANYLTDRKLVKGKVISIDKIHVTVEYVYKHSYRHVLEGTITEKEMIYRVRRLPEEVVIVQ